MSCVPYRQLQIAARVAASTRGVLRQALGK